MEDEPRVKIIYALTENDIIYDELGNYPPTDLTKALAVAEKLLRKGYLMVKLVKTYG